MTDQPKDDPKAQACPKCGGEMLARRFLQGFRVFARLRGITWSNTRSEARAQVCDGCGYAELYASNPEKLR